LIRTPRVQSGPSACLTILRLVPQPTSKSSSQLTILRSCDVPCTPVPEHIPIPRHLLSSLLSLKSSLTFPSTYHHSSLPFLAFPTLPVLLISPSYSRSPHLLLTLPCLTKDGSPPSYRSYQLFPLPYAYVWAGEEEEFLCQRQTSLLFGQFSLPPLSLFLLSWPKLRSLI
jgi:hypothetical protein